MIRSSAHATSRRYLRVHTSRHTRMTFSEPPVQSAAAPARMRPDPESSRTDAHPRHYETSYSISFGYVADRTIFVR
jgi:hypothetical protein